MNKQNLKEATSTATDLFLLDGSIDDVEVDALINLLKIADDQYFNIQDSILSDEQYDFVKQYAEKTDPTNQYFIGIGSEVRGGKVKLPHKMGSLTQSYEGDIEKWVEKHKLYKEKVTISDKLDGVSGLILFQPDVNSFTSSFQIAYSRGDGTEGADISRHIRKMSSVPKSNIPTQTLSAVRGEIIISETNFKLLCDRLIETRVREPYKNARNAVAGIMNSDTNPDWMYQYIDFIAYEVVDPNYWSKDVQFENLKNFGFLTAPATVIDGGRLTDKNLIDIVNTRRSSTDYAIDGIVLEVNDADLRRQINPSKETLNPEFARKYKVASGDNSAIATVVDVHWNVSKSGYLKPRVEIEPVNLVGVTITYATGFNARFIMDNKVGPGAKVRITRSGDVIPFIQEVVEPSAAYPHESFCGEMLDKFGRWQWTETGVDAYITSDHPDIAIEKAKDFFSILDVPVLREGNVIKLFNAGYDSPTSIIHMSVTDMVTVLGENGKKAFEGLHQKLTNVPLYMLMAASGAFGRGIGRRKLKALYNVAKGDLACFSNEQFICNIEGFDTKTAKRIVQGKDAWNSFFTDIIDHVSILPYEEKQTGDGELSGQTFCFTGFRDKALQQKIEEAGGTVADSYSKKVTCLVAKDPSETSTKLQKARKDGATVVGIDEVWEMVQ